MLTALLFAMGLLHSAMAATPAQAICGDWDMGPNSTALRIELKDSQSIFVQYCDRDALLNQHVCNSSVILYFNYSQPDAEFIHQQGGTQDLYATLKMDPADPLSLLYTFKSASTSGSVVGKKIAPSSSADRF